MTSRIVTTLYCDCGCKSVIDQSSSAWMRVDRVFDGATMTLASEHVLDFVDWSHLAKLAQQFADAYAAAHPVV